MSRITLTFVDGELVEADAGSHDAAVTDWRYMQETGPVTVLTVPRAMAIRWLAQHHHNALYLLLQGASPQRWEQSSIPELSLEDDDHGLPGGAT